MGFNLRRGLTSSLQKEHAQDTSKLLDKIPENIKSIDLNNKYVCITGTISGMTRGEAQYKLKKMYPKIEFDDSIRTSTNYLITGFGIGQTKIAKAQKLGIPMIEAAKLFN